MDKTVALEYKSSLSDLNFNSKPLINMLTMLADENKKHATTIVKTVVDHINSAPVEGKLPGLYLIDSIMKNLGDEYMKIFCQQIASLFTSVFEKVDENTRSLMFKLRQTWTEILPNKVLYNLDVSVKRLDPAWPITAKHASKRALVNPKSSHESAEEKKTSEVPADSPTSIKKEEDQIKQKQGEVLKQLLVKQEQLRQLELQKLQMSMKKKSTTVGSNIPASSSFKKNVRDPRTVKINISQNVAPTKYSIRIAQEKPAVSKLEICPTNSNIPNMKNVTSNTKAPVETSSISNANITEQCVKIEHQTVQQKKVSPKRKNKQAPVSSHKADELKLSLTENTASTSKTDTSHVKLHEKNSRDFSKGSKMTPKKKNISDSNKIPQIKTTNVPGNIVKKKIFHLRIPKKIEKQNFALKSDLLNSEGNKVAAADEKEQIPSSSDSGNLEMKNRSMKLNDIANKPKPRKTNDSEGNVNDLNMIAGKDEDLRVKAVSLSEDATSVRMPKRDILETNSLSVEMDKHPPRKKIKSEDAENLSPDHRSDTPVLFGNEDQDLRHSADWSQYKANHPDEYSPSPSKQENFDGRFRFRKHHFSHKYYPSFDYDRYSPFRPSRGRHFSRRNFHRKYFPRGMRGRIHNFPVMFDSHAILQQAEEKFRAGQISETEYIDLRHDLQKMLESSEYQLFQNYLPQNQDVEHSVRRNQILESQSRQEPEQERLSLDKIRIQRASTNPPSEKSFFLDGKERMLHFIEDKAIVLMDNNEPRELTFKDEQKKVYIDGMAEPITLGFDGKAVEFELDGQSHVMRFGMPGRELFINNHPYEAQFGGPPLVAMLEDGRLCKIHLSGPAPQVIIGTQPLHELFAKHHYDADHAPKVQDSHTKCDIPSSSGPLQDVDMRVKQEPVSQQDILMNEDSPFYHKGTKDVDWRQRPSTNLKESEKNLPSLFNKNASTNYETWINKDNIDSSSFQDRNDEKSVPKEPLNFEWNMTVQHQHPPAHMQQQRQHPPEQNLPQQRQHPQEQNLPQQRQHPQEQNLPQQRHYPPEQNLPQQRHYPSEHLHLQREHPSEHIQQQMQHFPPEQIYSNRDNSCQSKYATTEATSTRADLQQPRQHPPEHIHQHRQQSSEQNIQQHPSVQNMQSHHHSSAHMEQQPEPPLHSENVSSGSASQKWVNKQDNTTYWQNDNYRKHHRSSYMQESSAYQAMRASASQHFEEEDKYYDPHPHPSYVQRPFRGRFNRGRFPRYRPTFNADFGRQRQNAPLLQLPKMRFPTAHQKPLLPPPPLPPPFLSTSFTHQIDVSARALTETQDERTPGLLPTPGTSSEIQLTKPRTSEVQVDIESLLEKLVAAGLINTKMYEEPESAPEIPTTEKTDDDKEIEELSEEIPQIELSAESLRIHRPSVISALHKGLQCATCGMRFKDIQNDQYSRHLDWHFRMNRKEKDAKRTVSRPWYYEIEDWLQFEEFEDFEERIPSYFEIQADEAPPEVVEVPAIPSVPATNNDQECCPTCLERFQLFWVEDEEEWHYRNAVNHDNVAYHPACYEDFKKASEAEKALKSLEDTSDSTEIEEDIIYTLNTIIDDVCKTAEIIIDISNKIELPNVMEDVEVPPAEIHSDEEILEGKPGEEEIIGLISESDIEIDSDTPKTESKMVVMSSGGITLKVKAESLQCQSPSNSSEKEARGEDEKHLDDDDEIEFRPPTPDPNFEVQSPVSKGRELSGLCCIM